MRLTVGVLRIGLTGGIGAGKSAVAARLASRGAVVIDADRLARAVVAPGTSGLREVVDAFGPGVLAADGGLDRRALGTLVFRDPAARQRLERIIHPRVRARTDELTAAAPADAIVVNDVPLLVEAGLAPAYHLVIVVTAEAGLRVARLVRTRGFTEPEAYARIRAQADDARRAAAADVLLANDADLAALHDRVDALWRDRLLPYEGNLRAGRVARPWAGPADDRPDWAGRFARLAARVRYACTDLVVRADHIGPTALPEPLAAGPADQLLDVQLGLATAADAERVAPLLARAGFPAEPVQRPVGGPVPLPEPRHGSADPGNPARLHLRVVGTPAWRRPLLVRDWLRAEPDAGRSLLRRGPGGHGAGAGLAEAESWARRTGWRPAP